MRALTIAVLQLFLAGAVAAQSLYFELPSGSLGKDLLRAELEELEDKLAPHEVHWVDPVAWEAPAGAWGFGRWMVHKEGYNLTLYADFSSPLDGARPSPETLAGTCRACLRKTDGEITEVVIENALHDLLNKTLFDPRRGPMGYVEAKACSHAGDLLYRFPGARLDAARGAPGFRTVQATFWTRIYLGLQAKGRSDGPLQFHHSEASVAAYPEASCPGSPPTSPLAKRLQSCPDTDLLLEAKRLSPSQLELLRTALCTGGSPEARQLRLMLDQEEIVPRTIGLKTRTEPASGGH